MTKNISCRCITGVEKKSMEMEIEPGIKPVAVNFENIDLISWQTFSTLIFRYYKNGKEKKRKIILGHSYCPLCGKKYPT